MSDFREQNNSTVVFHNLIVASGDKLGEVVSINVASPSRRSNSRGTSVKKSPSFVKQIAKGRASLFVKK
ncbi:MAG: hypothetical protein FE834_10355 [Gammaproteobacteria bacterium]|nr:hypothetical protein [Gammaproteobacteria bacterium]